MTENIGKGYNIKFDDTVFVLTHEYTGVMGVTFYGIDGVFETYTTALNAKKICEEDKPNWVFTISEQKLINEIWKA